MRAVSNQRCLTRQCSRQTRMERCSLAAHDPPPPKGDRLAEHLAIVNWLRLDRDGKPDLPHALRQLFLSRRDPRPFLPNSRSRWRAQGERWVAAWRPVPTLPGSMGGSEAFADILSVVSRALEAVHCLSRSPLNASTLGRATWGRSMGLARRLPAAAGSLSATRAESLPLAADAHFVRQTARGLCGRSL
jgi:hypothetical protein